MRYLLKFYKQEQIIYISHLDLLRFFKRVFKRTEIPLQFSQGFNPHPKMSFAQPLSLGYASTAEYLEFETVAAYTLPPAQVQKLLNTVMPPGLKIIECQNIPSQGKTMAAIVDRGDYQVTIPIHNRNTVPIQQHIEGFLASKEIIVSKLQKKTGKEVFVDIKPMIFTLSGKDDDNGIELTMTISAGSSANLSPEYVISAFCQFAQLSYDRAEVKVCRTELYGEKNGSRIPLSDFFDYNI